METNEIIKLIEDIDHSLHERMSGNEVNDIIAKRIQSLTVTDRKNLILALRKLLSFRIPPYSRIHEHAMSESKLWTALSIGKQLSLTELKPDVEALLKDVRVGKVFDAMDIPTIERYLESLNLLGMTHRETLIESLRKYISIRRSSSERTYEDAIEEGNIWMALDIGKRRLVYELKPDVEALLKDAQENKVLYPAVLPSVEKYLESFNKMTPKVSKGELAPVFPHFGAIA